jgi:putative N6-adenine-specific DNA methylase
VTTHAFFATCPRGLEQVLADELATLGAGDVKQTPGGVAFSGLFPLCYRVNLESRIAGRVLWRVGQNRYRSEDDLYRAVFGLTWPEWFDPALSIKIDVAARRCPLKSLEFVTLRIKDAVCDRFRKATGRRPDVDTRTPEVRIHAWLTDREAVLYLDTSGEALFQRGFRRGSIVAPLKENLAAGLVRLSGWMPGQTLLDPMCGGGTLLLEAAMMALNIPPGWNRGFAFEKLKDFDADAWAVIRHQAQSAMLPAKPLPLYGSDADTSAIRAALPNFRAAGLEGVVTLERKDVLDVRPPSDRGVLLTNPPYGERIGDREKLAAAYPEWGRWLKQYFSGWRACIFTAETDLPGLMRLKPKRRTPLYNGPLECRLFAFEMVEGAMRRERSAEG